MYDLHFTKQNKINLRYFLNNSKSNYMTNILLNIGSIKILFVAKTIVHSRFSSNRRQNCEAIIEWSDILPTSTTISIIYDSNYTLYCKLIVQKISTIQRFIYCVCRHKPDTLNLFLIMKWMNIDWLSQNIELREKENLFRWLLLYKFN